MPHYLKFDSNTMNPSRIRRCIIKPEEIWRKNTEEMELSGNFAGLRKFATCKFCRLRIFAVCEHCSPVCLTAFDPPFCGFIQVCPSCNFVSLAHFCNFPLLSTYISSVLFVIKSTFTPSINQVGTKLPPLYWFCDFFSPFLLFSCIFLVAKHPLMMRNQGMLD